MTKEKVKNIKSSHQANLENQGSDNLPQGWEIAEFEKCLEKVTYTNKIQRKDFKEDGIYPIVSQEKDFINGYWDNEEDLFRVDKPVVIFGDHTQVIKFIDFDFVLGADGVKILKPNSEIDPKYFYYFLQNIDLGSLGYARHYKLLKEIEVQFPKSLPEQQRIVAILDETFSAIDKAKANAEQNLKNAKELFESYLQGVFEKKGDGWEEQLFENCFKLKSGVNLTAKNMTEGEYPVFGGNGIAGYHNEYNLSGSNVIIGRVGALCGNVRHINENIWLTDNAFKVVDFKFDFDHSFLTYLLNHKDLRSYARQAAQPVISNSSLKDVVLFFPKSKTEQQTIVRQLDTLRAETQKLEAVYQKKIDDLEELKKSVLQKAFAGELKTEKAVAV